MLRRTDYSLEPGRYLVAARAHVADLAGGQPDLHEHLNPEGGEEDGRQQGREQGRKLRKINVC